MSKVDISVPPPFTAPVYGLHKDRNIQLLSLTMTRRWLILADDLTGAG
jgi:hypothetical protein